MFCPLNSEVITIFLLKCKLFPMKETMILWVLWIYDFPHGRIYDSSPHTPLLSFLQHCESYPHNFACNEFELFYGEFLQENCMIFFSCLRFTKKNFPLNLKSYKYVNYFYDFYAMSFCYISLIRTTRK